jgi:hypothetical protein
MKIYRLIFCCIAIVAIVSAVYTRSVLMNFAFPRNESINSPDSEVGLNEPALPYNCTATYIDECKEEKQKEFYEKLKQTSFKFMPAGLNLPLTPTAERPRLFGNAGLDLSSLHVCDADLEPLADVPIELIVLDCNHITDDGMKILSNIKTLRYLFLRETDITDASARYIAKMKNLEVLVLMFTNITDKFIIAIAENCKQIRHLEVDCTEVNGSGFAFFPLDTRLEYLSCSGGDDSIVKYILQMKELKIVELSYSKLTDKGLMQLARHKNIRHIGVEFSSVTKRGIMKFIKKRKDVFIRIGMGVED